MALHLAFHSCTLRAFLGLGLSWGAQPDSEHPIVCQHSSLRISTLSRSLHYSQLHQRWSHCERGPVYQWVVSCTCNSLHFSTFSKFCVGVPVSAKMPGCCCPVLCRFLIAVRFLVAERVAHVLRTEGTPPEAKKARTGAKVGKFRFRKRYEKVLFTSRI